MRFPPRLNQSLLGLLCCALFSPALSLANPPELSGCGALFDGAIINTAPECINDSAFLVADRSKADDFGWQYSFDSVRDGVYGNSVGGTTFEYYGIAIRETDTDLWLVINSNLPLLGLNINGPQDGNIGHGDLFINLGSETFLQASDSATLFGVKYSATNDSGAGDVGVYGNVKAKSVTAQNIGFNNLGDFINHVNNHGGVLGFGDLPVNQTYYAQNISLNVIQSGAFLGAISQVTSEELAATGFRPNLLPGTSTVAFRFAREAIVDVCGVPGGDGTSCLDCAGLACGHTEVDQCGVCGGDGTSCLDCAGTPFGALANDACGVCGGDNSSCADCSGAPNGSEKLDQCGVCGGDGTSCLDCAGVANGESVIDQCGVCGGDGKSCLDCAGTINGNLKLDDCGVCGGDDSSCLSCETSDISQVLMTLDGDAVQQRHVVQKSAKLLAKFPGSNPELKALATQLSLQAEEIYHEAWTVSWSFPWEMKDCAPSPLCTTVDNAPGKNHYQDLSSAQYSLAKQVIRKLKHVGVKARRVAKLRSLAKAHYTHSIAALNDVPASTMVCQS